MVHIHLPLLLFFICNSTLKKMDYFRTLVSLILLAVFFYLFGYWSIVRLMDNGIILSQSEIEPVNIKPPGTLLLIFYSSFFWAKFNTLGIFLTVSNHANLPILSQKCAKKNMSLVAFKKCIHEVTLHFIRKINAGSHKEILNINERFTSKIIIPSDGSIKSKQTLAPTIALDPKYQYHLYLFDRDFNLFIKNPAIIQRSFTMIDPNSSFLSIYMQESHDLVVINICIDTNLGYTAWKAQQSQQSLWNG